MKGFYTGSTYIGVIDDKSGERMQFPTEKEYHEYMMELESEANQ